MSIELPRLGLGDYDNGYANQNVNTWNSDNQIGGNNSFDFKNWGQQYKDSGLGSILGNGEDSGMLGGAIGTIGGLGSLYGMYQSFGMKDDYMDMMKEQMGMAREQWGITKDEINSINNTKARLNAQYNSQDTYTAPAKI